MNSPSCPNLRFGFLQKTRDEGYFPLRLFEIGFLQKTRDEGYFSLRLFEIEFI